MTQLDVLEAGRNLKDLIARARAGEEVVIVDGGKPVARLLTNDATIRRDPEIESVNPRGI